MHHIPVLMDIDRCVRRCQRTSQHSDTPLGRQILQILYLYLPCVLSAPCLAKNTCFHHCLLLPKACCDAICTLKCSLNIFLIFLRHAHIIFSVWNVYLMVFLRTKQTSAYSCCVSYVDVSSIWISSIILIFSDADVSTTTKKWHNLCV